MTHNADRKDLGMDKIQNKDAKDMANVSSQVVREVLIPEIEKEVNEGKNFANLRQIYNSMILAVWYKQALKESLLGQVYADKNKVKGVDVQDKTVVDQIYNQYLDAFKKGAFNFIRVERDMNTNKNVPRKYFSGGAVAPKKVERQQLAALSPRAQRKAIGPESGGGEVSVVTDLGQSGSAITPTQAKERLDDILGNLKSSELLADPFVFIDKKDATLSDITKGVSMISEMLRVFTAKDFQMEEDDFKEVQRALRGLLGEIYSPGKHVMSSKIKVKNPSPEITSFSHEMISFIMPETFTVGEIYDLLTNNGYDVSSVSWGDRVVSVVEEDMNNMKLGFNDAENPGTMTIDVKRPNAQTGESNTTTFKIMQRRTGLFVINESNRLKGDEVPIFLPSEIDRDDPSYLRELIYYAACEKIPGQSEKTPYNKLISRDLIPFVMPGTLTVAEILSAVREYYEIQGEVLKKARGSEEQIKIFRDNSNATLGLNETLTFEASFKDSSQNQSGAANKKISFQIKQGPTALLVSDVGFPRYLNLDPTPARVSIYAMAAQKLLSGQAGSAITNQINTKELPGIVQHQIITMFLRDVEYCKMVAKRIHDAYYEGIGEDAPDFITDTDTEADVNRKVGQNLPGSFAFFEGIVNIAFERGQTPFDILDKIASGEIKDSDREMIRLAMIAHATWLTSQPFLGISRLTRPTVQTWLELPAGEKAKDFVQIRAAAKVFSESLKEEIKNIESEEDRTAVAQEANAALELIKQKRNITPAEEKQIINAIETIVFAHRNQQRKDGSEYSTHPLEILKINNATFNNTNAIMDVVALFHDMREDQGASYESLKNYASIKLEQMMEGAAKEEKTQRESQMRLAIRLLSKLTGEKYAGLEDPLAEYYLRLAEPRMVFPPRAGQDWYTDAFVRGVQTIKMSDVIMNWGSMKLIFDNKKDLTQEDLNFPKEFFTKIIDKMIPIMVQGSKVLTERDREEFYSALIKKTQEYADLKDAKYAELAKAAQDALVKLEKIAGQELVRTIKGKEEAQKRAKEVAEAISKDEVILKVDKHIFYPKGAAIAIEDVARKDSMGRSIISGDVEWFLGFPEAGENGAFESLDFKGIAEMQAVQRLREKIRDMYPGINNADEKMITDQIDINIKYSSDEDGGKVTVAVLKAEFSPKTSSSQVIIKTNKNDYTAEIRKQGTETVLTLGGYSAYDFSYHLSRMYAALKQGMQEHPNVTIAEGKFRNIKMQLTGKNESFEDFRERYNDKVQALIKQLPQVIQDEIQKAEGGIVYHRYDIDQDGSPNIVLKTSDFTEDPITAARTLAELMLGTGEGEHRIIGQLESNFIGRPGDAAAKEEFDRLTQEWKQAQTKVDELRVAGSAVKLKVAIAVVLFAAIVSGASANYSPDEGFTAGEQVQIPQDVSKDKLSREIKANADAFFKSAQGDYNKAVELNNKGKFAEAGEVLRTKVFPVVGVLVGISPSDTTIFHYRGKPSQELLREANNLNEIIKKNQKSATTVEALNKADEEVVNEFNEGVKFFNEQDFRNAITKFTSAKAKAEKLIEDLKEADPDGTKYKKMKEHLEDLRDGAKDNITKARGTTYYYLDGLSPAQTLTESATSGTSASAILTEEEATAMVAKARKDLYDAGKLIRGDLEGSIFPNKIKFPNRPTATTVIGVRADGSAILPDDMARRSSVTPVNFVEIAANVLVYFSMNSGAIVKGRTSAGEDTQYTVDEIVGDQGQVDLEKFTEEGLKKFQEVVRAVAEGVVLKEDEVGGIDLGTTSSALQIKRDGNGMVLPFNQQSLEFQNIDGFTPFIINVMPFNSAALLSQIEGSGEKESATSLSPA